MCSTVRRHACHSGDGYSEHFAPSRPGDKADDEFGSVREHLQNYSLCVFHYVWIWCLISMRQITNKTAAETFLAAETRKVNSSYVTKMHFCCLDKAAKWHKRWIAIAAVEGMESERAQKFLACEELNINLKHDQRFKVTPAAPPPVSRNCMCCRGAHCSMVFYTRTGRACAFGPF